MLSSNMKEKKSDAKSINSTLASSRKKEVEVIKWRLLKQKWWPLAKAETTDQANLNVSIGIRMQAKETESKVTKSSLCEK